MYVFGCRLSLVRLCDSDFWITCRDDITIGITCAALCFHMTHISLIHYYYYYYYYYYRLATETLVLWSPLDCLKGVYSTSFFISNLRQIRLKTWCSKRIPFVILVSSSVPPSVFCLLWQILINLDIRYPHVPRLLILIWHTLRSTVW